MRAPSRRRRSPSAARSFAAAAAASRRRRPSSSARSRSRPLSPLCSSWAPEPSSSIYSQPIRLSAIESSSRYQTRKPSTWDPEPSVVFFRLMWCSWLKCDVVACGRAHSRSRLRSSAGNRGQGPPEAYIHICIDIYAHVQIYIQIYIHTHPYGDRGQGPPETYYYCIIRPHQTLCCAPPRLCMCISIYIGRGNALYR